MTRYVVKKNSKWAVVNANYKKSIKIFTTQEQAIKFSKELLDTTRVVVQGKDNKFRSVLNVKPSDTDKRKVMVPVYVYKNMDSAIYRSKFKEMILYAVAIMLVITTIIFVTLYALEATTWKKHF